MISIFKMMKYFHAKNSIKWTLSSSPIASWKLNTTGKNKKN